MVPVVESRRDGPGIVAVPSAAAGTAFLSRLRTRSLVLRVSICIAYSAALIALAVIPHPPPLLPDVVAHAAGSGIQAALLYWVAATLLSPLGSIAAAWLGATAFEGLNEVLQFFLPPRTAELTDLVSAMIGASVMLAGVVMARRTIGMFRAVSMKGKSEDRLGEDAAGRGLAGEGEPGPQVCIHCREPIHPKATRCPRCLAWQSRWAGDSQSPRLELALLVGGVVVVALLGVWLYRVGSPRGREVPRAFVRGSMVVVEAAPVRLGSGDRKGLAVVGTVRNATATAWRDPYLQVRCFDREGKAIDTFPARAIGLVVPASGRAPFKVVEGAPLRDPAEYGSCKVDVTWAVRAE